MTTTALKPYDFEVAEIRSLGLQLAEQAEAFVITSDEDDAAAKAVLASVDKGLRAAKARHDEIKAPALAECNAIDEAFREATDPFKSARLTLAIKTGDWTKAVEAAKEAAKREEERREREALAARLKAEAEAAAKGEPAPELPAPVAKPAPVPATPAVVHTDAGSVGMVKIRGYRVVDETQIPREYWLLDVKRLAREYKAGDDVPGCVEDITYKPRTR